MWDPEKAIKCERRLTLLETRSQHGAAGATAGPSSARRARGAKGGESRGTRYRRGSVFQQKNHFRPPQRLNLVRIPRGLIHQGGLGPGVPRAALAGRASGRTRAAAGRAQDWAGPARAAAGRGGGALGGRGHEGPRARRPGVEAPPQQAGGTQTRPLAPPTAPTGDPDSSLPKAASALRAASSSLERSRRRSRRAPRGCPRSRPLPAPEPRSQQAGAPRRRHTGPRHPR